jgi:hypothetical protein
MPTNNLARRVFGATALLFLMVCPALAADVGTRQTSNLVLIVSDGLRWQEIFTGADPKLLNEKNGGIWDSEKDLKREFWRDDPQERRKALFPFIWNTVATHGQIFGNRTLGSRAQVTNGKAFSYPGYNEMLTGHPDARIDSNEYGPNPNRSVLEWLNSFPELHGSVNVYASWATFKDILNVNRSHLPMQVGWEPPYPAAASEHERLVDRLYATTTRLDDEDVYDSFVQVTLLDFLAAQHPHVLFVGYGETDNWAHAGRYDLVLHSAHLFDHFVEELWNTMQGMPAYRDHTTFIITTDHGRGGGLSQWKEHGVEQPGSENIWIAVMGPDTAPVGELHNSPEVHQAQIAATVAAFLGKDYVTAEPAAATPLPGVIGSPR